MDKQCHHLVSPGSAIGLRKFLFYLPTYNPHQVIVLSRFSKYSYQTSQLTNRQSPLVYQPDTQIHQVLVSPGLAIRLRNY